MTESTLKVLFLQAAGFQSPACLDRKQPDLIRWDQGNQEQRFSLIFICIRENSDIGIKSDNLTSANPEIQMDTMKWNWSKSISFIFFLLCEVERRDVLQWSVMDGGDKGAENKTRSKVEKMTNEALLVEMIDTVKKLTG